MRVEFPARFFNRLAPTTTDKQDQMIFSPGGITNQLAVLCILNLNHRRGEQSLNHARLQSLYRGIL
jgi:hypothetical protein